MDTLTLQDFTGPLDSRFLVLLCYRIFMATLCGAVIGFERETTDKGAGLRTLMIIAIGTAAPVAMLDLRGTEDDPLSRPLQGIYTGLWGYAIFTVFVDKDNGKVRGGTTAAAIIVTGMIGTIVGMGFLPAAVFCTGLVWFILRPLRRAEEKINPAQSKGEDS